MFLSEIPFRCEFSTRCSCETLWASFDMLMPGVEDIRGRLGVAYQALGCFSLSLILFVLLSFFRTCVLCFLSLSLFPFLFFSLCVHKETFDHQLSRTSGIKRAKKPVYLAGLQDRRSHAIVILQERKGDMHLQGKQKKNVYGRLWLLASMTILLKMHLIHYEWIFAFFFKFKSVCSICRCASRDKTYKWSLDVWTKITEQRWGEEAMAKRIENMEPPLIIGISRLLRAYHNTMYN